MLKKRCAAKPSPICISSVPEVGLQNAVVLPESSHYDSVLCSHVMDVDWDGQNEIIIGTYGKQILIYKKGMCRCFREDLVCNNLLMFSCSSSQLILHSLAKTIFIPNLSYGASGYKP